MTPEDRARQLADEILRDHGHACDHARGLVPLPERMPAPRVVPPLPFSAYAAMLRGV